MAKRKTKKPKQTKKPRKSQTKQPAAPASVVVAPTATPPFESRPSTRCRNCGAHSHEGNSEESLVDLDPEAAVFYDRDVADTDLVVGLCGPRFRISGGRLHAHYGWPGGIYKVFEWGHGKQSWGLIVDNSPRSPDDKPPRWRAA